MQNPKIQQILGMNPQIAQAMQAAMTAQLKVTTTKKQPLRSFLRFTM
jgi:hypothetical protein